MKKLIILAFAAGLFVATGCSKEWTCTCDVEGPEDIVSDYGEIDKGDAEDLCEAQEAAIQVSDPEASCSLDETE